VDKYKFEDVYVQIAELIEFGLEIAFVEIFGRSIELGWE
jgi:hypothetical protein